MCFIPMPMALPYDYVCAGCGETHTEYEADDGVSLCPECRTFGLERGWNDEDSGDGNTV